MGANSPLNSIWVRLGLAAVVILALFSPPAREFLKLTLLCAIPFLLFLGLTIRCRKYSPVWIISSLCMVLVVAGYGYMLTDLPEQIEARKIISEGAVLVAEGKYDQAIENYRRLEGLGRIEKMNEEIAEAEKEKEAAVALIEARAAMQKGDSAEAIERLESIPRDTRAAREANKLLKELREE